MSNAGRKIRRNISRQQPKSASISARQEDVEHSASAAHITQSRAEFHYQSGPTPSAEELARLKMVYPESPEIIFGEFQKQAEHRRWLEKTHLLSGIKSRNAGMACGLITAMSFLYACYRLIMAGHDVAGGLLGVVDIVGLVAVFVYRANAIPKELKAKRKQVEGEDNETPQIPSE